MDEQTKKILNNFFIEHYSDVYQVVAETKPSLTQLNDYHYVTYQGSNIICLIPPLRIQNDTRI